MLAGHVYILKNFRMGWVLTPQVNKALNRLEKDAYPERQKEHAVEESTEELSSLPSKGKGLWSRAAF